MSNEIIVAALALIGTLAGSYFSNNKNTAVMDEKIKDIKEDIVTLSNRVDKHNQLSERMIIVEQKIKNLEDRQGGDLYETVQKCIKLLKPGGRLCIITFHSLEDRAVKNAYVDAQGKCTCPKDLPYCVCGAKSEGKIVNKKPIIATEEEQIENSRSKSAKLRIFEKKQRR